MDKEIKYRGYKIEIVRDTEPVRPDEWENEDVFVVYDHRSFHVAKKGFDPKTIFQETHKKVLYAGYFALPLYAYIHSGVTLGLNKSKYPFTCQFDVSMQGFVMVKRKSAWAWTKDQALKKAQLTVDSWNEYLSGNVWGYSIPKLGDSCYGFYGDPEAEGGMISEAKAIIDSHIKSRLKKQL